MNDEILDWILSKHERLVMVVPVASKDPWTLHGPEALCVSCLQLFVGEYLSDIPDVIEALGYTDETGGI